MKNPIPIILVVLTLVAISCSKVLDDKIEYWEKKVVLYGYLYPGEEVRIYLHESKLLPDYFRQDTSSNVFSYQSITEAEVELYENGRYAATLQLEEDPPQKFLGACYMTKGFKPETGNDYTIKVITEDHPLVEASTHIPEPTAILSLTSDRILKKIDSRLFEYNRCVLTFEDNPDQEDYYGFSWKTVPGRTGNNVGFLGQDPGIEYPPLFRDHIIINDAYNLILDGDFNGSYMPGDIDTIHAAIQLLSVTRDHYLYHRSILETQRRDYLPYLQDIHLPITEPSQIYTNVKNGLGLFTGIAYDADTVQTIFYHHTNPIK
jgi:hypothetical protein